MTDPLTSPYVPQQTPKPQTLAEMLEQRGNRYGSFDTHAAITQQLKEVMQNTRNWRGNLSYSQKEALEMIAHKIGRILNGDPYYADSWVDIVGYTQLVVNELADNSEVPF
jgi:hypothetical protein